MFHGFSDKPPTFIRKAMRPFDTDLPNMTTDHLSHLSALLPAYREILKVMKAMLKLIILVNLMTGKRAISN